MAGDWIKMRGALIDHPKVIAITRHVHGARNFRDWITPGGGGASNAQIVSTEALRCVTTALLMRVWSVAREHGKFEGADLILAHSVLDDIDEMAGAPGVGAAMVSVGWVVELGEVGLQLPNFIEFNVPMTPAEKQQGYRERKRTGNETVTEALPTDGNKKRQNVTTRVEKRREDLKPTEAIASGPVDLLNGHPAESKFPNCPQIRIVALYREMLPAALQPKQWDGINATNLGARWRETCKRLGYSTEEQGVEWFKTLFTAVDQSDFLMGRKQSPGRDPFKLRLAWIVKKANFEKIIEGAFSS